MRITEWLVSLLAIVCLLVYSGCPATQADAVSKGDDHSETGLHEGHEHADVGEDGRDSHDHGMAESEADGYAGHDHSDEAVDENAGHDHEGMPETEDNTEMETGDAHEAEDEHVGHDHGDEAVGINLSLEQIRELSISSAPAGPGSLGRELQLTGEVTINEDAVIHVSPRIGGIIRKVHYGLGDHVTAGATLLELDSIDLAELKGEYLTLLSRIELAESTLNREQALYEKGISAEQDYLAARQALEEEHINRRSLERKLETYGLSRTQIEELASGSDTGLTSYLVSAPVSGEIIEKHASLGESVGTDSDVYTIGDMSTVWVRLNVYQQDFLDVREGMHIVIDAGHGIETATGKVDYIEPLIGEETRTAVARVVLKRSSHVFRPGLFVTGFLEIDGENVDLVVPRDAVVDLDQDRLVFVRRGTSFEPRVVNTGRQTAASIEILGGLEHGEEIVVTGAFQLKAELLKGTFDPHAGHAH